MNRKRIQILTKLSAAAFLILYLSLGTRPGVRLTSASADASDFAMSENVASEIIEDLYREHRLDKIHHKILIRRAPFLAREFDIPGGFDSLKIKSISRNKPLGLYPLIVEIFRNGAKVRHGQATAYIARFDSVLVADGAFSKGELPVSARMKTEFIETTSLRSRPITTFSEMEGKRFRRNLRRGMMITEESLELIPDIEFGDRVTIEYNNGSLIMTTSGSALGKGIIGETVRVRNLGSKKIIHGTITGSGTVRVNTPGG